MWDFEKFDDNIAIITENDECISYAEISEWQDKIGKVICAPAITLICCRNEIGCVLCYLGCMKLGVVPLLVPEGLDDFEYQTYLDRYRARYLICSIDKRIYFQNWFLVLRVKEYAIYECKHCENIKLHKDLALLLPTSGSMGLPKCVRISRSNIESNTESICQYLPVNQESIYITSLPMCYTYGLSNLHIHLACGGRILLTEKKIIENDFWIFFDRYNANSFAGVPSTYGIIRKFKLLEKRSSLLKVMTQAGGALSRIDQKYFAEMAYNEEIDFFVMYGQTEATARISYMPPQMLKKKLGSVGIAIPGGKLSIERGEVVYEGSNVSMGYAYDIDDLKKGDENYGKLYTGDLGYLEEGYLYLTGRKSREVKINGIRVNLDDMENKLNEHYASVFYCIYRNSTLFVFTMDRCVDKRNICHWICGMWHISHREVKIYQLDHLPLKFNGKISYNDLLKFNERKVN